MTAPQADMFGQPGTIGSAQLSPDRRLRFTLKRMWAVDRPRVCFIGHNPSTAGQMTDDPTTLRWTHFARSWGYGGYVAVNLYPLRSSKPDDVRRWANWEHNGPDWGARDDLVRNRDIAADEAKRAALVVACWGAIAQDPDWIEHTLEAIQAGAAPWPDIHVFGLTRSGQPIHPMARGRQRVPDDARPVLWRRSRLPPVCIDCGLYPADPPSKRCPGCEAYKEHQA